MTIRLGDEAEGAENERERRRTPCVPGVRPLFTRVRGTNQMWQNVAHLALHPCSW